MSKTYDKIREFQKRHQKPKISPVASEESCNKYVSDLLSKKGSVAVEGNQQEGSISAKFFLPPGILKTGILLIIAILIIVIEGVMFSNAVRESRSQNIQLFRRLNSVEKELAESRGKLQNVEKELRDSQIKFLTVSKKLDQSEVKVKTLEQQLSEQKARILSLTAAAQAPSQKR